MTWFEPSTTIGKALRRAMDGSLWASVSELFASNESVTVLRSATPLDYGAYSDLVLNIPDWQTFFDETRQEAEAYLRCRLEDNDDRLGQAHRSMPRICNFTEDFFSPVQMGRFERWFCTEEANLLGLAPAEETAFDRLRQDISRALDYMEMADTELHGEIFALVSDIIVVSPNETRRSEFTAGSSFAVWGAILANADLLLDWTEIYNMFAHEEGHILLLAIARDEPLVLNANDAVYRSPVRDDLRPMDGIYHTAFVAAREARALDRLLAWNQQTEDLSRAELEQIEESLEVSVITFWQSVEAIEKDGLLSGLGASILDECKEYMTRNFEMVME